MAFLNIRHAAALSLPELRQAVKSVVGASKLWTHQTITDTSTAQGPSKVETSIANSYTRCVIPLSNVNVRECYMNNLHQIRFGKLLEDLDTFAVYLSYKHSNVIQSSGTIGRANFSMVTGMVDHITVPKSPINKIDLNMIGYVSWVGQSSLEVTMHLEQVTGFVFLSFFHLFFPSYI